MTLLASSWLSHSRIYVHARLGILAIACMMSTTACGLIGGTTAPVAKTAVKVVVVEGADQSGQAGRDLGTPIVLRVLDSSGVGISGVTVTLSVVAGGGTVTPASDTTDASGQVTTKWTLGPSDVTQEIVAATEGVAPVSIMATGLLPTQIVLVQGNNQSAKAGSALINSIIVRVVSAANVPMQGVTVGFQVLTGGGGMAPATVVTNALGEASTKWTVGAVGPNTASVVVGLLAPVSLTATGM